MLPTEDALWVGEDLQRRFGLPYWQFTLTATDANRFCIRIARKITQRPRILVYDYCYHGTVDESFASLHDGVVGPRRGNIGPPVNPAETTRVVEFNDLNALEDAAEASRRLHSRRTRYDQRRHHSSRNRLLAGGLRAHEPLRFAPYC